MMPFHRYSDLYRFNHSRAVVARFRAVRASKRYRMRGQTTEAGHLEKTDARSTVSRARHG
jgi:hypothetical protein